MLAPKLNEEVKSEKYRSRPGRNIYRGPTDFDRLRGVSITVFFSPISASVLNPVFMLHIS